MSDVTRARGLVLGSNRLAREMIQFVDEIEQRDTLPTSDVEDLPSDFFSGTLSGQEIRRDHIVDVSKVTGLKSVTKNRRDFTA